ncbi:PREDICTED: ran-binding protein 3-like isoform X2 [Gekko japonicus]|uniref:Ran-binding protein 3-like isoform X2 n=1 Tax=Gekko japonicus TaxID=146911 RepID=A0ABM1JR77_GEKJA|nr:PREDICTED: ran-binding protein 3-like isoform X2 [Gekko japonicus]
MRGRPHFTKRKDCSDTWTMDQAGCDPRTNVYLFHSLENRKQNEEYYDDKSLIAQPIFVFKKKDRPCKRPAEDYECKTENVFMDCSRKRARASSFSFQTSYSPSYEALSQKRMRSSSFTILPTFPPSSPVKKNNIFMTSTLLHKGPEVNATEKGLSSPTVQRVVLRPAVLQPPQTPLCREVMNIGAENVLEDEHKAISEVSEETCSLRNCSENAFFSLQLSGPETTDNLLAESKMPANEKHLNFVFGENIVERVLRPEQLPELHSASESQNSEEEASFATDFTTSSPWTTPVVVKNTTLVESAASYASKTPTQQYLLDKVEVSTGEETEHNVLQINCKLFLFNKTSMSWIERGSGSLRLNDTSSSQCGMLQSRLVMRNQGSMRLILNAKLWSQMVIQRANRKSLCITATDLEDHSVKVFLIQASSKDIGSLDAAIHHRLVALRSFAEQGCDASQVEPELPNCDSDEEETEKITHMKDNESDHSQWIRRQSVVCS